MDKVYFVGGIGTDVGKTVVTGMIARHLLSVGVDATTVKLVQTGSPDGKSGDVAVHRALCGISLTEDDASGLSAPQVFRYPSSPALAARLEGKTVDLDAIAKAVLEVSSHHAVTLVEAAGGLAVPLTEDILTIDFAAKQDWPLILVANSALGSINHTILSLEAARSRNMHLAGVVMNGYPEAPEELVSDAFLSLRKTLSRLGYAEHIVSMPADCQTAGVDFGELFA
ncbi:MAG: dethiobiotin synthase [Kiritimatiellae bacterium]|nr:dethiobiotin synthase [Kiritimatiellia bacterium]